MLIGCLSVNAQIDRSFLGFELGATKAEVKDALSKLGIEVDIDDEMLLLGFDFLDKNGAHAL